MRTWRFFPGVRQMTDGDGYGFCAPIDIYQGDGVGDAFAEYRGRSWRRDDEGDGYGYGKVLHEVMT